VFAVALAHAVFLGLPLFLFFRAKSCVNTLSSIACGFAVGSIPLALLTLQEKATRVVINGAVLVEDGSRTQAGWISYFQSVLVDGLAGAVGGVVFLLVWKWSTRTPSPQTDIGGNSANPSGIRASAALGIALTLVGASLIPFLIPFAEDNSCHNIRRGGHSPVTQRLNIDLDITFYDRQRLLTLLMDFGKARSLSFRNSTDGDSGTAVAISLCKEPGLNIQASDNWTRAPHLGARIAFYDVQTPAEWQSLAKELVKELNSAWPDKVRFRGPKGEIIPTPQELLD